jgi:hypothetical protein
MRASCHCRGALGLSHGHLSAPVDRLGCALRLTAAGCAFRPTCLPVHWKAALGAELCVIRMRYRLGVISASVSGGLFFEDDPAPPPLPLLVPVFPAGSAILLKLLRDARWQGAVRPARCDSRSAENSPDDHWSEQGGQSTGLRDLLLRLGVPGIRCGVLC